METKIAQQPSMSPDQSFESSFFQLAYSKLQDKLYNILPFLIGFEVVKKSDDNTKALGVFGFKANNGQIIFVPAFFANGAVKDLDLMYSKNNEQFYPLNEDWAYLFLKDEGTGLGDSSGLTRDKLLKDAPPLDFRSLVIPPRTGKITIASVVDFVEQAPNEVKKLLLDCMENEKTGADLTESMMRYYPLEKIAKAIAPKVPMPNTGRNPEIEVIRPADKEKAKKLTNAQKQELFGKGYYIVDSRKKASKNYAGVFQFTEKFTTPVKSTFCNYVTKDGRLAFGLVITRPLTFQYGFPSEQVIVVNLDKEGHGYTYETENCHVHIKDQLQLKDISSVMDMMQDPAEGSPGSAKYILVNENLKATVPFRIVQNFKDGDGLRRLVINPTDGDIACRQERRLDKEQIQGKNWNQYYRENPYRHQDKTLIFTKKTSDKLTFQDNFIYVPKGFKLLKVVTSKWDVHPVAVQQTKEQEKKEIADRKKESDFDMSAPGCLYAMNDALMGKGVFPFTLRVNGSEYFMDVKQAKKTFSDPVHAKIAMVTDFGLDEKQGEELVDLLSKQTTVKGYIKLAATGDYSLPLQDEAPWTNELGQPTTSGVPYQQFAPTSDGYTKDPTQLGLGVKPDVQGLGSDVQSAIQAASTGQKEIFDTQMIATLAKYVNPAEKVLSYIPTLVESLDKVGRMLFLLNWDTEKFQEMYGRDELPELTELLKNIMKNVGDLVIFMKRKFPDLSINANEQSQADA